jgi:CHAT domain-containing protein
VAALLLSGLLGPVLAPLPAVAADPPGTANKEARKQLQRRVIALSGRVEQLYDKGQFAEAVKCGQEELELLHRIYPKAEFPHGHRNLALALGTQSSLLESQGDLVQALSYGQKALAMFQSLYPKEKYPKGHPDLVQILVHVSRLCQAKGEYTTGLSYAQDLLAMNQRLYPKDQYPNGHPDLAKSLTMVGFLLWSQGQYTQALDYYRRALAMTQRVYPRDKFPAGHLRLAEILSNLGSTLMDYGDFDQALYYDKQAAAMWRRLSPPEKDARGSPYLAMTLSNLSGLQVARGDYAKALEYNTQVLALWQRQYPPGQYTGGHPMLAVGLNNRAFIFKAVGERAKALDLFKQALAMRQRLYPKEKYPRGHPLLAASMTNLGLMYYQLGDYAKALEYDLQALDMNRQLFAKDKYPRGHRTLAINLNDVGLVLAAKGEYARALDYDLQAVGMNRLLYPPTEYPHGHGDLASGLLNLSSLRRWQGDYANALDHEKEALAIWEGLYPPDRYPLRHPNLAASLSHQGALLAAQGNSKDALNLLRRAVLMEQRLVGVFMDAASEAESLRYLATVAADLDLLLSASAQQPDHGDSSYALAWTSKAAAFRSMRMRRQALAAARESSTSGADTNTAHVQRLWQDLVGTQRALARRLLAPAGAGSAKGTGVQQLTEHKEDLERRLARRLPSFARQQALDRLGHESLVHHLPPRTAFIDLLRYVRLEQDPKVRGRKGERRTASYVAFVLRHGQPVRRVELGEARPIEEALLTWLRAIAGRRETPAAGKLRQLLWDRLAEELPGETETVWLAPDGPLATLPWAALPGRKPGTVLLEDHALAVVPHGPFLLDQLTAAPETRRPTDRLLAVGGVRYDGEPAAKADQGAEVALRRSAETRGKQLVWRALPATLQEIDQVVALAGKRNVTQLRGTEASTERLLAELPRAAFVHLATHGFFADAQVRSALQIDESLFERRGLDQGPPPGARNPLVLSGLVLAGANLPPKRDEFGIAQGDGGILTAEAIVGLPLGDLHLAVLSACETGLGTVAGREGVFGLQRAFHLAGAHNVVASLWTVDDQATAALMGLFYHKLWKEGKPPLAALREAQLYLYRHPDRIADLARQRGLDFEEKPLPPDAAAKTVKPGAHARAPTRLWAAFVLSGSGR